MSIDTLSSLVKNIKKNLCLSLAKDGFLYRTFYAEEFALALLKDEIEVDLSSLHAKTLSRDRSDFNYHHEFINYALMDYLFQKDDIQIKEFLYPLKFKKTTCTNWSLLRLLTKAKVGESVLSDLKKLLRQKQQSTGQILDDKYDASMQYHAFSALLLFEIYEVTQYDFCLLAAKKALEFIRPFILNDGDTLYLGRGQEQFFGYASLVMLLVYGAKWGIDTLKDIESVLSYIKNFESQGYLPLVLQKNSPALPHENNLLDTACLGWYSYNNYFDYLAFGGYFLAKAEKVLKNLKAVELRDVRKKSVLSPYKLIKMKNYSAVISIFNGRLSDRMAIPYVLSKSGFKTKWYGGEQFAPSLLDTKNAIPEPFYRFTKTVMVGNWILWFSLKGFAIRHINYFEESIEIKTYLLSPFVYHLNHFIPKDESRENYVINLARAKYFKTIYSGVSEFDIYRELFCSHLRIKI